MTKKLICCALDLATAAADPALNPLGRVCCIFDLSGEGGLAFFLGGGGGVHGMPAWFWGHGLPACFGGRETPAGFGGLFDLRAWPAPVRCCQSGVAPAVHAALHGEHDAWQAGGWLRHGAHSASCQARLTSGIFSKNECLPMGALCSPFLRQASLCRAPFAQGQGPRPEAGCKPEPRVQLNCLPFFYSCNCPASSRQYPFTADSVVSTTLFCPRGARPVQA